VKGIGRGSEHFPKISTEKSASRKKWHRNNFLVRIAKLISQKTKKVQRIVFSLKCNKIIVLFTTFLH